MNKVLVTGGAGFIGSHVVDKLIERGVEPRIFDLVPSSYHPDVDTITGDLTDLDDVRGAVEGCDAVIHLAADPAYAEVVNSRGTFQVLEAARLAGVKRVVYGSTIWVYNGQDGIADEDT